MSPRIRAQRAEPILFAHRGASADAPENTIEAFRLALEMGATGLESDVWLTRDGQAVLVHDERIGRRPRRRRIAEVDVADLPAHVPTLPELFEACGTDFELSLDLKDPDAISRTVTDLQAAAMVDRTWLCDHTLDRLATWRQRWSDVKLVHSTRLERLPNGPERHASDLYELGVDTVNFKQGDWSGGLTALYHRFERLCFGWDAHHERVAVELLDLGIDAIYSNHVDRMHNAYSKIYG